MNRKSDANGAGTDPHAALRPGMSIVVAVRGPDPRRAPGNLR